VAQSCIANPADSVEDIRRKEVRPRSQVRHRLLLATICSNLQFRIDGWQLQLLMQKEKEGNDRKKCICLCTLL